jgi:hypothetical protein
MKDWCHLPPGAAARSARNLNWTVAFAYSLVGARIHDGCRCNGATISLTALQIPVDRGQGEGYLLQSLALVYRSRSAFHCSRKATRATGPQTTCGNGHHHWAARCVVRAVVQVRPAFAVGA